MGTRNLLIRSSLALSLTCNFSVFAQHDHHQHHLKEEVKEVVKFTEKAPELKPELCPDPKDRAFVNFDPSHLKDPEGFHGMLFFGQGDTFYISHLPMFHKPHNYQAILEVKLKPEAKAKYKAKLAEKGGYFTFAPSGEFVLPEMVVSKKGFSGTLVQGHFERGGEELLDTDLEIVRVVFYKQMNDKDKKPAKERYAIFGKDGEYYMAHEVFERPNVDEIIPLPKDFPLSEEMKADIQENGLAIRDDILVKDGKIKILPPVAPKGTYGSGKPQEISYTEFYRETGDLR